MLIRSDHKSPPHPGEWVRALLAEHGLNVTEGARAVGVARVSLSRLVNGESSLSGEMAVRLSQAFGVNVEELLERQFPIESPTQRFTLRSARDFAEHLAVHVNHLNRAIRLTTGKTTTEHIFERLTSEAKTLLKHTNWNISEIGYSLGFEEPAHFNHFFKKQTTMTPSAFRN